jgi:hypothetical protein
VVEGARLESEPEGHEITTKCHNSLMVCHNLPYFAPPDVALCRTNSTVNSTDNCNVRGNVL